MILTKKISPATDETTEFIKKFYGKKKYQNLKAVDGKIIYLKTNYQPLIDLCNQQKQTD